MKEREKSDWPGRNLAIRPGMKKNLQKSKEKLIKRNHKPLNNEKNQPKTLGIEQ